LIQLTAASASTAGLLDAEIDNFNGGHIGTDATVNVTANNISVGGSLNAFIDNSNGGSIGGNAMINMNVSGNATVAGLNAHVVNSGSPAHANETCPIFPGTVKRIHVGFDDPPRLAKGAKNDAEAMPPIEALRAWMLLFVDYIATKQIIAPALNTFVGGPSRLYEGSRAQIRGAIDALVKRAIKSGDIRRDLDSFDLLRALIGVSNVASSPDWQQSTRRLVDILITGSRPVK